MQRRDVLRLFVQGSVALVASACSTAPETTPAAPDGAAPPTIAPTSDASGASNSVALAIASSLERVIQAFLPIYTQQTALPTPNYQAASSSVLAQQITGGAAFDIFCSADKLSLTPLIEAGILNKYDIHTLASTELVVIAQPSSTLQQVNDITTAGTAIVVGDASVPVGRYTELLWKAIIKRGKNPEFLTSVQANIVSYEDKASSVVQKFFAGEADVAVVYAADLAGRDPGSYRILTLPPGVSVKSKYYGVLLPGSKIGSIEFLNLLLDSAHTDIWKQYGFDTATR